MTNLQKNSPAPNFSLPNDKEETVTLSQLQGQPVVLYFYPKDNTSGCTSESLQFTELQSEFNAISVRLIGISPDSIRKHQNFRTKHGLTPILLSDTEKEVVKAYGIWKEKNNVW